MPPFEFPFPFLKRRVLLISSTSPATHHLPPSLLIPLPPLPLPLFHFSSFHLSFFPSSTLRLVRHLLYSLTYSVPRCPPQPPQPLIHLDRRCRILIHHIEPGKYLPPGCVYLVNLILPSHLAYSPSYLTLHAAHTLPGH